MYQRKKMLDAREFASRVYPEQQRATHHPSMSKSRPKPVSHSASPKRVSTNTARPETSRSTKRPETSYRPLFHQTTSSITPSKDVHILCLAKQYHTICLLYLLCAEHHYLFDRWSSCKPEAILNRELITSLKHALRNTQLLHENLDIYIASFNSQKGEKTFASLHDKPAMRAIGHYLHDDILSIYESFQTFLSKQYSPFLSTGTLNKKDDREEALERVKRWTMFHRFFSRDPIKTEPEDAEDTKSYLSNLGNMP